MGAAAGTGPDRLAVWEWEEHGERVAGGHWLVSDAERAAAGRETIAERSRALLPGNRDRAALRYADGGCTDGQEMTRVWFRRDAGSLAARLAGQPLTAWAEDGVLHVLWRGDAARATLAGGIQLPLWPVDGAAGLWEASVRVRRLDEAVITLAVSVIGADDATLGRPAGEPFVFRGPRAPATAPEGPLAGELHRHVLESAALRAPREVTVYVPPGAGEDGPLPGCVLADGQSVPSFVPDLEAAILAGTTPPVVLVGVHNGMAAGLGSGGPAAGRSLKADPRSLEYLPSLRSGRFGAHMSFVADEVIPWAAGRFPVPAGPWLAGPWLAGPWLAAGFSNGGVWAIAAGQRRPDVFGGVAALSAGVPPRRITSRSRQVRHYLAAGALEPGFRRATGEWAARLERAGMACRHREWPGGHDNWWWHSELPRALSWLLAPE